MEPNQYSDRIARVLRVDKHVIAELEHQLDKITGKVGVLKTIVEENDRLLDSRLSAIGLNRNSTAEEVYDSLISKIESDDLAIFKALGIKSLGHFESAQKVTEFVRNLHPPKKGYFLKYEKAKQLLIAEPPKKILAALGYKYVEEMLQKEDLLEVYSALRFLEEGDWLNNVFF